MLRGLCLLLIVALIGAAPQEDPDIAYVGPLDVTGKPQDVTPEDTPTETKYENEGDEMAPERSLDEDEGRETDIEDGPEEADVVESEAEQTDDERKGQDFKSPNTELSNVNKLTTPDYKPDIPKKVPTARFLSKLSYFKSNEDEDNSLLNFIERTSKRHFRSRCRCEKITNCPKLQISVPRCPEDYFMCCF